MNFSFPALDGAAKALTRLHRFFVEELGDVRGGPVDERYGIKFLQAVNDDLNTPQAIAVMWDMVKDDTISLEVKRATLLHFDKVFGLGIVSLAKSGASAVQLSVDSVVLETLPVKVQTLIRDREQAREDKDWTRADELRVTLKMRGYNVEDSSDGPKVTRT